MHYSDALEALVKLSPIILNPSSDIQELEKALLMVRAALRFEIPCINVDQNVTVCEIRQNGSQQWEQSVNFLMFKKDHNGKVFLVVPRWLCVCHGEPEMTLTCNYTLRDMIRRHRNAD